VPGAAKAYNAFTMSLTGSTVSYEGVQEVAVVLNLLTIRIREHTQLVRQRRSRLGVALFSAAVTYEECESERARRRPPTQAVAVGSERAESMLCSLRIVRPSLRGRLTRSSRYYRRRAASACSARSLRSANYCSATCETYPD
jgi:hypothetical protein